ncbi:MAG: hypothetical protein ACR2LQ_07420 [Acidimicrobiales bacterium]
MVEATPTCESCGRAGEELAEVHRVYVTPGAWDADARIEVVEGTERWCFACRTHYPHQLIGAAEPEL